MLPANPTQRVIDWATVEALESVIRQCKRKRESLRPYPSQIWPEQVAREEGFRGALAWVEGFCCEEINRIRGVG